MIDKIIITLNDSGKFDLNIGDIHFVTEHTTIDVLKTVNYYMRELAYFPTGKYPMSANPIPYREYNKKILKSNKNGK